MKGRRRWGQNERKKEREQHMNKSKEERKKETKTKRKTGLTEVTKRRNELKKDKTKELSRATCFSANECFCNPSCEHCVCNWQGAAPP